MTKSDLHAFLIRHRFTVDAFAALLGVTKMAVHHWLYGHRSISLTVARVCKMFDKHPELIKEFSL